MSDTSAGGTLPAVSVVVPVRNEAGNIAPLISEIAARLDQGYLDATTLMEYFIAQGVPMRLAHEAVGKLVRLCEERRCRLAELPPEVYETIRPGLGSGVYKVLGVANALAAFRSAGSTAPAEVDKQLLSWRAKLATEGTEDTEDTG